MKKIEPNKKKIIFLDIDGVLNNDSFSIEEWSKRNPTKKFNEFHYFNEENVKEFNRIIRETNASIVISSTWRVKRAKDEEFYNQVITPKIMEQILEINGGVNVFNRIIGFTPDLARRIGMHLYTTPVRYKEIEKYIKDNNFDTSIKFVVIDDDTNAWKENDPNIFVNTLESIGLTAKNADHAIRILNS